MHSNSIGTKVNNLKTNQNSCSSSSKSNETQPYVFNIYMPFTKLYKQISTYCVTIFSDKDKQLNLVTDILENNNYCELRKLLQKDKTILLKLINLPKEKSPIATAIKKKNYECIDILYDAILKFTNITLIPQYLKQYLFIYACKNPDADISKLIIQIYQKDDITLTSEQIDLLLINCIDNDNLQIMKLLINKVIASYDDTKKNEVHAEIFKKIIKKNKQHFFYMLIDKNKELEIDIFDKYILVRLIAAIMNSNNTFFLKIFLMYVVSINNEDILFDVFNYFILSDHNEKNMSIVLDVIKSIPRLLLIKNKKSNLTILHTAFYNVNHSCALKLLEYPIVKKHINNPYYYAALNHRNKCNLLEVALTNCRNEQYKKTCLPSKTLRTIKKISNENVMHANEWNENKKFQQNKTVDYLDLATLTLEQKAKEIFTEVLINISNISCIGIYLHNILSKDNTNNNQSYSFGDENAVINVMNRLIFLGCRNINLYIPLKKDVDKDAKIILINKIYYLLNVNCNGNNNLIKKAQCTIKLCFIKKEQYSYIPDEIILNFQPCVPFEHVKDIKNLITLRPFLFSKYFEEIHIKNTNNTGDPSYKILAINNPVYSILKEEKNILPLKYGITNDKKKWYYDLLLQTLEISKASLIVDSITTISENIQGINHGVIYGLHHRDVFNKTNIINNWMNLLKSLNSKNDEKPIVLSIPVNTLSLNIKQLSSEDTLVFDFISMEYNISTIKKAFTEKKNVIILYPCLPKAIFYHLIDQANIPILIEGANTTSYALQTAKPYLSLLPLGSTAIPTTMGDPMQALFMEATSYKITLDPEYLDFTKKIFDFVKQDRYLDAINSIYQSSKKHYKRSLKLFYRYEDADTYSDEHNEINKNITILSLLEKGHSLSASGKKHLLKILNPDTQSILDYVHQCQQYDSLVSWHFKLMKHHVNLEINNTVDISLYKFFKQA